jgi:hypothetical protein
MRYLVVALRVNPLLDDLHREDVHLQNIIRGYRCDNGVHEKKLMSNVGDRPGESLALCLFMGTKVVQEQILPKHDLRDVV